MLSVRVHKYVRMRGLGRSSGARCVEWSSCSQFEGALTTTSGAEQRWPSSHVHCRCTMDSMSPSSSHIVDERRFEQKTTLKFHSLTNTSKLICICPSIIFHVHSTGLKHGAAFILKMKIFTSQSILKKIKARFTMDGGYNYM